VKDEKLEAVWEFRTSPLFGAAERAALEVALAGAAQPNAVSDDHFTELKKHWSEAQIVEIVAVISLFGFMNRWNDTMATPLEAEPLEVGEKHLARQGWAAGKHRRG
jgi:alkylhydroperoxidase family enzyme